MQTLSDLPNISPSTLTKLCSAGIDTPEKLVDAGSKTAFLKIRNIDETEQLNTLYALEGAVRGIRWHHLSPEIKGDLKTFYSSL